MISARAVSVLIHFFVNKLQLRKIIDFKDVTI